MQNWQKVFVNSNHQNYSFQEVMHVTLYGKNTWWIFIVRVHQIFWKIQLHFNPFANANIFQKNMFKSKWIFSPELQANFNQPWLNYASVKWRLPIYMYVVACILSKERLCQIWKKWWQNKKSSFSEFLSTTTFCFPILYSEGIYARIKLCSNFNVYLYM